MKLNLSATLSRLSSAGLAFALLAVTACGPKTLGSNEDVSFTEITDATGKIGSSDNSSDARASNADADKLLKEMIEKERADRISEDDALKLSIAEIEERIDNLEADLRSEIARLDEKDKELEAAIAAESAARTSEIEAIKQSIANLDEKVEDYKQKLNRRLRRVKDDLAATNDRIKDLESQSQLNADLIKSEKEAREKLALELEQVNTDLEQSQLEMEARLRAEMKEEVRKINQELDDFKLYAAMTYATKEELKSLSLAVENLTTVTNLLNDKIDDRVSMLEDKIDSAVGSMTNELVDKIDAVRADVDSLRDDLNSHISEFDETVTAIYDKITEETTAVKDLALDLHRDQNQARRRMNQRLASLEEQTANVEYFVMKTKRKLMRKIEQLEAEDAALSADIRAERQRAAAKLSAAIAKQERKRKRLQRKVAGLVIDLEAATEAANTAYQLAKANQQSISTLSEDLEAAKAEFQVELDALESRMSDKMKEVKEYAEKITADLSAEVQQQFTEVNGRFGELEQRVAATEATAGNIFSDKIGLAEQKRLMGLLDPSKKQMATAIREFNVSLVEFEKRFIDVIDPIMKSSGINVDALEDSFASVATSISCQGNPSAEGTFASVQGKEFFFHLARQYVTLLFTGARSSDAEIDSIFQGLMGVQDVSSFAGIMMAGNTPAYSSTASGACHMAVASWTKSMLIGSSTDAKMIREKINGSAPLLQALTVMYYKAGAIQMAADAISGIAIEFFKAEFGSAASAESYLKSTSDEGVSKFASLAQIILEETAYIAEIDEIKVNRERFIELARDVAKIKSDKAGNTTIIDQFNADLNALNQKVDALANTVDSFKDELKTLRDSQIDSFSMIAAIAARLGYGDLVEAAKESAGNLGGDVDEGLAAMPASCMAAQHFYNHATIQNLAVSRCESNLSYSGKPLDYYSMTRCAIHGNYGTGSGSYTWGNQNTASNGWRLNRQWSGGQKVGNGLRIYHFDPTDTRAITLAQRSGGSAYPSDRQSTFVLRVFGRASKFKIDVTSMKNRNYKPYSVTVDANTFKAAGGADKIVYEIPLPKAIQRLGACRWDREIKVVALDENGNAGDRSCLHRFHTFSPIVLNLAGAGMIETINPQVSNVKFDLDANGLKETLGWIKAGTGLLAIDLNDNGRIDDGRELFGESTRIIGTKDNAEDGYIALAQYDSNKDNMIDSKDAVFNKLKVWVDLNQDGQSQPHELKTLADLNITKIATDYTEVAKDKQIQSDGYQEANIVKYESKYWGPQQCGEKGCASYDVFFGSTESTFAFGN